MRVATIERPGEVRTGERAYPSPTPGQVVVRVGACGVCGTDLHIADGEFPPSPYPLVPGHEFSGEIVETGPGATADLRVGDRVAVDPSLFCGFCDACSAGRGNLCANWGAIGDTVDGAFAEYVSVPAVNCHRIPESMSFREGALVEPLSCAVHGLRRVGVSPGEDFLLVGAGTMGLLLQQLLQRGGARVAVADRNTERLAVAESLGARATATSVAELGALGVDAAVDATGAPAAIEAALATVRRGGRFLVFGVAPEEARVSVSPFRLYNDEITIVGSMAVLHSFRVARDLLAAGAVDPAPLLTHALPLARFPEALDLMRAGAGVKIQVVPELTKG
ncbi:zinc-dependent alcohol dehydrogenase family protein [Halostreptopolyspora alba]|uniref:Alcohol dehydrogenase n=1 Tax=Halostreptopolyspora alba TaxID=2487137 RepID=A0A3N0EBJ5_9ACTN|nr:alcohol dehydrogenase [Nocardiopsaceae bacterium YIM 96095]